MAGNPYSLEQLDQDLYDLASKLHEMKALEQTIDEFWARVGVQAIPLVGTWFQLIYDEITSGQEGVIISSDAAVLEDLPDRCRRLVGIDSAPFHDAAALFESTAADMVGIEGAPGNILSNIGNWYGDAAEAFEEYFSAYSPAQARQAELFASTINACSSLEAAALQANAAVQSLMAEALKMADQMIAAYKDTQKALEVNLVIGILGIAAAGFGVVAAAGAAAAIAGAASSGAGSLVSSIYAFSQIDAQLEASDSNTLVSSMSRNLASTETAIMQADEEIYSAIEALRGNWSMREIAIPAPPGSDEVDTESFHHESSL
ncbi:hypothetical protein [Glycomyces terrestris]|uniref:Uncharacterized protein n=1 Tax=Glycomyces terrestris TaxID=2493553 RepID=A0A426UXS6_9ACTN|nr:hypothetical protein [Glycomyces terrestris]RRR99372.1 hypothetical protein EIW28_11700 [Glycomyces terrestris]